MSLPFSDDSQASDHADAPLRTTPLERERQGMEAALRASGEKFRLLVEGATEFAMFLIDPDGRITSWNEGARRILGYEEAEVLGHPAALIFTPEDRASGVPERELAKAAREGRAADVRWHLRKDGSRFWGDGTMERLSGEAGEFKGFAKMLRDATEAKRAQDALRASEERLRDAQMRLDAALSAGEITPCTVDLVNNRVTGDAILARFFSVRPEDVAGGRLEVFLNAIHEEDRARATQAIADGLASGGNEYEDEYRVAASSDDSSPRWLSARAKIERDAAGAPLSLIGAVVDITARKRLEAELRQSEARLRLMADSMPQIAWTARADGGVEHYNQGWYDYSGLTLEETRDWGWQSVIHPDDLERATSVWVEAVGAGTISETEYRLRRRDGQWRWHLGRSLPVRGENNQIVAWVGTATDIQNRVEAEAQARRAARVLDAASDAYVTLDRDFRITYVNAEAARINKKPAEAFVGRLHWDEWPASVGTTFERQFRRAMTERVSVRFLERYHVPGEYDDWIDVAAHPAADEDGGGLHLVYRDVTKRVQHERRERFLAELAERARTLIDPKAVIADTVRSVGEFLQVSRCTFADIDMEADTCTVHLDYCADASVASIAGVLPMSAFGPFLTAEFMAGRAVAVDDVHADAARVPPDNVAAYEAIAVRAYVAAPAMHSARLVSMIAVHSATPRRWKPEEVELLQTVAEQTWLTVEVARQHSALAREAEERREAHQRMTRILESITDAFFALDTQWRFTYINRQAEALWGRARAEMLGRNVWDEFSEAVGSAFDQQLRRALSEGVVVAFEEFYPPLDAWLNVRAYPSRDGFSVFFQNVNERKRVEEERERLLVEEQTRAEREALINKIGAAVRATSDPEEMQARAVTLLGEALGLDLCHAALAGEYPLSVWRTLAEEVILSGTTSVFADVAASPALSNETKALLARMNVRAFVNVAFLDAAGAPVAGLSAGMANGPRNWTPHEVELIEAVATLTRAAAESARVQQRERNIAQQLQAALQPPPPPDLPGLALEGFYRPALEEAGVGGDAYDVFPVEKGCTALVVFDVAGKGLAAASEVAAIRNMLRYALYTGTTLAHAVTTLNRVIEEQGLSRSFATLLVGMYDQAKRTLTYANCGQEPGLVWRAATGEIEHLSTTGPVLGGFAGGEFTQRVVVLAPGDVIALFTDGLTEVGPTRRQLLGVEGVTNLLKQCCADTDNAGQEDTGGTARHVLSCLVAGVDAYARGGARDDIALLIGVVGGQKQSGARGEAAIA